MTSAIPPYKNIVPSVTTSGSTSVIFIMNPFKAPAKQLTISAIITANKI